MSDSEKIDQLQTRIEELEDQLATVREQLMKAELDQWEGRIDDLEVQLHLGALETRDRLSPLVENLRNAWLDAREQTLGAPSTAVDVVDALRSGVEKAMKDIRDAVLEAKTTVIP